MGERERNPYNIAIVIFVALGSLSFGYSASIVGSTLAQPSFNAYFEFDKRSNTPAIQGAINGLYTAGGLIGTFVSSYTAEKLGRKKAILLAAIVSVIGGALQAGSTNLGEFIFVRLITGLGVGSLLPLIPLYQSEISPPHSRGLMVGIHGVCITVGYCSSAWVGFGFYFVNANGAQWRIPLAIQAIPPLFLAVGILFLPESPRWLISRGRNDSALAIVKKLHKDATDPEDIFAHREFAQITEQFEIDRHNSVSWRQMFTTPSYRKRMMIGFFVMFGSQVTATTVISNYAGILYPALGFSPSQTLLVAACWITLALTGNTFNAFTLDWIGRVNALKIGWIGDWFALLGEIVSVSQYQRTGSKAAAASSVAFLFVHIFFFSFNVDATSYVYISELFPTHIRAKGMAFSISGYFLSLLILLEAAPSAFSALGYKFYIIFIVALTLFIVPLFVFLPETKGIPLEEIGRLFNDEVAEIDLYASKTVGNGDQRLSRLSSDKGRSAVRHEHAVE